MATASESRTPEGGISSDLSPERAAGFLADEAEWEKEFNEAVRLSEALASDKDPETRRKAVDAFKRAILLDRAAVARRMRGEKRNAVLSPYMTAVYELNRDAGKKKKSGAGKYFLIGAGVAALGALVYFLTQKKEEPTPPPEPKDVTITLDAYNSTEGFKTDLTAKTVKEGSAVAIKISDTGVTGIDTKYVAVYTEDFKKKISFDSDGEANFTAPTTDVKYHVIMFDELGINIHGDQVSYDWMDNAKLYNGKRKHVVFRKDYDGQTMQERVWGDVVLPETGGKGVYGQMNDALNVGYTVWGSTDRQPNGTSGDYSYGAGDSEGADGYHYGDHITVNAEKINEIMLEVATGLAEDFENRLVINNIGDRPSHDTISRKGVLVQNGKNLLVFVYIRDSASFTSSTTGAAAVSAAVNTIDVNKKIGPVEIGLNSGNVHAGFKNEKVGVNTNFRMNGKSLENYTAANFTGDKFQAGVGMTLSPHQKIYTAQSTLTIDKVVFGVSGGYDANSRIGNIAANVGAKVGEGNVMFGVSGTPEMLGFSAQATQALKDIGIIGFHGIYTKSQLADFTALGFDANLDKIPVNLMVDYSKLGLYENLRLGLGARILGGTLSLGLDNNANGKNLTASYTVSIPLDN